MTKNLNRRKFLKILGCTGIAGLSLSSFKPEVAYSLEVPSVPLDPNSDKAKQFGYYEDATKVDTAKFPKRVGEEGKTQFCDNCQLLVKSGIAIEGKEGSYGACSLFQEGVVAEKGWCNMWVKKVG